MASGLWSVLQLSLLPFGMKSIPVLASGSAPNGDVMLNFSRGGVLPLRQVCKSVCVVACVAGSKCLGSAKSSTYSCSEGAWDYVVCCVLCVVCCVLCVVCCVLCVVCQAFHWS